MKKAILFSVFLFGTFVSLAQKFEEYDDIKLKEEEDFYATEDKVIECADYIMTCTFQNQSGSKQNAVNFLVRWATGAPYDFTIQEWISGLMKQDDGYVILGLSALIKYKLEHKDATEEEVQAGAAQLVYDYIKNPQFRIAPKGYVKKFVAAGDAGTLAEFIAK